MTNSVTAAEKQRILETYLKTPQGRAKIAQSMTQPLRTRRDYSAIGRKTFLVEQLPDGALPIYDKDPDVAAYVVGEEGDSIQSVVKARSVIFPLFEIASLPEIPLAQIRERRFDVIERAQELGRAQIQAAEDERVFAVMDGIATSGFDSIDVLNADIPVVAPLSAASLIDAFAQIERHDLRVARIYMNAVDHADLRKFGRDILDPLSQKEILDSGFRESIYGANIIVSRLVPAGTVYVCCEPEMFGRIPVRAELTVISADDPRNRTIAFSMFENLGIGCHNPRGLCRLSITR